MSSSMTTAGSAILDTRRDHLQYDARRRELVLDLYLDDDGGCACANGNDVTEKSTTLRSEDSGIVMMSEIQREGLIRLPRSPGFHFGLDEESARKEEEAIEQKEEDDEEEEEEEDEEEGRRRTANSLAAATCSSPGLQSQFSQDSHFHSDRNISSHSKQSSGAEEEEDDDEEEDVWTTPPQLKSDELESSPPPPPVMEDVVERNQWKGEEERWEIPANFVEYSTGVPCTDAYTALGILKTRFQLADVNIRKRNLTRLASRPLFDTPAAAAAAAVSVSRLYDRPKYEYPGSKQLREITNRIETRDRNLSIILTKILAEDERSRKEEDEAQRNTSTAATKTPGPLEAEASKWAAVPELNFFAPSVPGASYNLETLPRNLKGSEATRKPDDRSSDAKEDPAPVKKHRSILRRALNGLRKSFSRRSNPRV